MGKLLSKIEVVITELTRLETIPQPYRDENDDFPLPRIIYAGDGKTITINQLIDTTISRVADQLMDNFPNVKTSFTLKDWRTSVRNAFGPALASTNLNGDLSENARTVHQMIVSLLDNQLSGYGIREHTFGCTLFSNEKILPFDIGPVRFELRRDWLIRKHLKREISHATFRRVDKKWKGERIRKRRPSRDYIHEQNILDAIGSCPYVCSVTTKNLSPDAAREKSLTAARLSTAAISLLWKSSSRQLDGMNLLFDRRLNSQITLSFVPGKLVLAGWRLSHSLHGPYMKDGVWEEMYEAEGGYFNIVGEILAYVISPSGNVDRPKMMNTLAQALLWFHEGCRETETLMAIVKFSATLDALAGGLKTKGIHRLIKARLEIEDNVPVCPEGPNINQAIQDIYAHGRSRTIHGTNEKLGHDWSDTRSLAEQFARLCLVACIYWASDNPTTDDPTLMAQ